MLKIVPGVEINVLINSCGFYFKTKKSNMRQTFKQITAVLCANCNIGMEIRDIKDAGITLAHRKIIANLGVLSFQSEDAKLYISILRWCDQRQLFF